MNYKPNFNATGLVKSSTHKLGVIIPAITNYYFSIVNTGIQEIAQRKGYNIILYLTNDPICAIITPTYLRSRNLPMKLV